jgi:hypothetical protein
MTTFTQHDVALRALGTVGGFGWRGHLLHGIVFNRLRRMDATMGMGAAEVLFGLYKRAD